MANRPSRNRLRHMPRRLYRKRDGIGQTLCSYERYLVIIIIITIIIIIYRWDGYPAITRFRPGTALPGITRTRPGITLKVAGSVDA